MNVPDAGSQRRIEFGAGVQAVPGEHLSRRLEGHVHGNQGPGDRRAPLPDLIGGGARGAGAAELDEREGDRDMTPAPSGATTGSIRQ